MDHNNQGGTPAAQGPASQDHAWDTFETRLAGYLATMIAPTDEDHLVLEMPQPGDPDGGCTPYAQFAAFADGTMIRAEVSGNGYLAPAWRLGAEADEFFADAGWSGNDADEMNWYVELPVEHADAMANHAVWALRVLFGIPTPDLLTQHAWGPASSGSDVLGLCATDEVPADLPSSPGGVSRGHEPILHRLAIKPVDRDDLLHLVESVLREKYEVDVQIDDDGDFELHHLGQLIWVRVRQDQPAVEIMARVVHGVRSRRATAVELALLNRENLWTRWQLRERTVWQTIAVPALPFAPRHLSEMLDLFHASMTAERDDLVLRTGGKVA